MKYTISKLLLLTPLTLHAIDLPFDVALTPDVKRDMLEVAAVEINQHAKQVFYTENFAKIAGLDKTKAVKLADGLEAFAITIDEESPGTKTRFPTYSCRMHLFFNENAHIRLPIMDFGEYPEETPRKSLRSAFSSDEYIGIYMSSFLKQLKFIHYNGDNLLLDINVYNNNDTFDVEQEMFFYDGNIKNMFSGVNYIYGASCRSFKNIKYKLSVQGKLHDYVQPKSLQIKGNADLVTFQLPEISKYLCMQLQAQINSPYWNSEINGYLMLNDRDLRYTVYGNKDKYIKCN